MKNTKFVPGHIVKTIKNETDVSYILVITDKVSNGTAEVELEDIKKLYDIELIIEHVLKLFKSLSGVIDDFAEVVNTSVDDMLKKIESTFINQEDKIFKEENQAPDEDDYIDLKHQKKTIQKITNDPKFKSHLEEYLKNLQNIYKTNGHLLHEMLSFEQGIIKYTRNISTALGNLYDK